MEPHDMDQAVFALLRKRTLRLARAVAVITLPLWLLVLPVETKPVWVSVELASTLLFVAAFPLRARLQARVLVALLIVVSAVGLLHFGPTMGTGSFMLACMLAAVFFLEARGVVVTLLVLILLLSAAMPLALRGVVVPVSFAPDRLTWIRMIAGTLIALGGMSFVHAFVLAQLRASLRAEFEARRDAQAAQAERERALRAMEAGQRLENLGRLAGGGAHDINNALGVIQGCIELLRMASDPAEREQVMREIMQGVRRAAATAKQLLAFSRQDTQTQGSCEPAEHLRCIAQTVSRFLPANIAIEVEATAAGAIDLSPGPFEQVLLNLVLNARDALPNGGCIRLSCGDEDGCTVVDVTDTGVGMSPEVKARMFEPFFTTKGQQGTGLGLASVRREVTMAGGEVTVDSTLGRGTTIRLRFPTRRAHSRRVGRPNEPLLSATRG
jgi:signal transduction histidine kinase